jgi:arylsulfatase A-like enzyme
MIRMVLLLWFALLSGAWATARPNIIVLLADGLGYGDVGCYRGNIPTPQLDELAAGGTRALLYYTAAPEGPPARASLLTGRHPARLGWGGDTTNAVPRRPVDVATLPRLLRDAGYVTAHVGHWDVPGSPREHGFEQALTPEEGAPVPEARRDGVLSVLDQLAGAGRPFFLNVWFESTPGAASPDAAQRHRARVVEWDACVGRLTARLRELGLESNTLVVFTAATGPGPGGNTQHFRGEAGTLLEGGLRVPFLVRWPGVIKAGRTVSPVLHTTDVLPTLCAAAGVKPAAVADADGINLLEYLQGRVPAPVRPFFVWQHSAPVAAAYERHGIHPPFPDEAVMFERWKVLFARGQPVAVFNIYTDSAERADRLNDPREAGALKKVPPLLAEWRARMGLPAHEPPAPDSLAPPPAR